MVEGGVGDDDQVDLVEARSTSTGQPGFSSRNGSTQDALAVAGHDLVGGDAEEADAGGRWRAWSVLLERGGSGGRIARRRPRAGRPIVVRCYLTLSAASTLSTLSLVTSSTPVSTTGGTGTPPSAAARPDVLQRVVL